MKRQCTGSTTAPTKLTRWVDPSFCDLTSDPVCEPKKLHPLSSRAESKRPDWRRAVPAPCLDKGLKDKGAVLCQDEPWVDCHAPHTQSELAVHKKKIEEVEKWLTEHLSSSRGGVLLVTGPSGCGKTATVQVLSRELGARIQEWSNPVNMEHSSQQDWQLNGLSGFQGSQLQQFQDFLFRANKYSCLQMSGEGAASLKKVILVEDFPNQFYRQPSSLHDTLRRFVKTSRVPLVFIVSDSVSADSSSRHLFPRELQEELHIAHISFNPVAPTTMMKVLSRVSALEVDKSCGRLTSPDRALLERLCTGCSGDIRSAINSLQFSCIPDTSLEKSLLKTFKEKSSGMSSGRGRSKPNRAKKSRRRAEEEEQAIGGKDASLFLFRALGKILHCKRGIPEGSKAVMAAQQEGSLPPHLSQHHREPLLEDPEMVVERSHMSSDIFSLYLHQNYLDFFCEMESVERASEYLSDADLLSANWTVFLFQTRSVLSDYSSSVATRGLLHCNSQQATVGFRPLHKPHWLHVLKNYRGNCRAAQTLFKSFCLTPVALQTELLPYLAKLSSPMRNQAQIDLIQDVGQLSLRRIKLETVADKELGQLPEDSEGEEAGKSEEDLTGSQESLPDSQTQPGTVQALLQPEELLIEEYDSD
ncbi:cell cycle checkpoint protein RAD17 isoform X2 [Boleophthalmus pectinirostris]|uniref:cell cycle checkpoint protein RAD17 isoform X2 n=1 Tax=Boleophthalmus pectinirostris TaxID=150288 RepID=UPI000A1C6D37|nr:cell cycle checkpoint protein RAD17 isoform X2 [Boleophthalmus pectinirostris]